MNLVSLIMKFLTPDLIMKLASALGLDKALIEKGIGAIVPSILSGLAGAAARPEGARTLADTLGKIDPGMLGNLAGMIGGSNQGQLVSQGSSMLSGVLGNSALGSLTGVLGKFTGMNEGATKSLLGMLAPAVMGTLGQQARASNLDASGIANLLSSQRDNISAAMPQGLGQLLGGAGLLEGVGGGAVLEGGQGRLPDPARGRVHDALEGDVVGVVGDDPQVGQRVADLFTLVERRAASDRVRHPLLPERLFQHARERVGAVQDGHVPPSEGRARDRALSGSSVRARVHRPHPIHHEGRLVTLAMATSDASA